MYLRMSGNLKTIWVLAMADCEDWLHVSLTHFQHLSFLHTDMVSGMNTVFLSRRLTMGINTNCRITGFNTVIRGKLSDRKYAIKSGLKGKSSRNGNPTGVGNSNGLIPKKYLLLLLMYRFRVTKIIP